MDEKALLLVMMDIAAHKEEEFNRWYNEDHIPERMTVDGFRRARRYIADAGSPRYLALYDVEDISVFQKEPYRLIRGANKSKWTSALEPYQSSTHRIIYRKIFDTDN